MSKKPQSSHAPEIEIFEEALPGSLFERLVRGVRSIGNERLKKNYTTTFWLPTGAKPNNVAEEAALQLRRMVHPGPRCGGIEWWLGRLGQGEKLRLHFDRDMTVRKKTGRYVHPLQASVLYLNTFAASPTVILDQIPGTDGKSRIPVKSKSRKAVDAVANRYVVFPGNHRHGVIPATDQLKQHDARHEPDETAEVRLTLLVNFWERRPLPPICFDYDGSIYGLLQSDAVFHASGTSAQDYASIADKNQPMHG